jgi:protein involved in polysaccharide export with SLBB domain
MIAGRLTMKRIRLPSGRPSVSRKVIQVASFRLLLMSMLALLAGACTRLDYSLPATIQIDQSSRQAAQVASQRLEASLADNGDFHPGDLVRISFPFLPTLDAEQRVQPSGFISPPLLAPIQTDGLTAAALQQRLQQAYKGKLRHPHVAVALVEYNRKPAPPEFFVLGEVVTPGPKEYRDGLTLVEALARAGGANRSANLSKVVVMEPEGTQLVARMVDVEALLTRKGPGARMVPVIAPNAIVIVPPTNLTLTADRARQIQSIVGFSGLSSAFLIRDLID